MKAIIILITSLFALTAFAAESTYTSVKTEDCITIDSSDFDEFFEIDYYTGLCKGQGPYTVQIAGGDLRYSLSLLYRGNEITDLTKTYAFHDMGSDVVEWRSKVNADGSETLQALIFRISAYEEANVDLLHVAKLAGKETCTVAVLRNEKKSNLKARAIADNIDSYSCL